MCNNEFNKEKFIEFINEHKLEKYDEIINIHIIHELYDYI